MASIQYSIPSSGDRASAIYTDAMARMYGLVALGIVVTGAAIWVGHAAGVGDVIFALGWIGMLLFFGVIFGTLYAANAVVQRGNIALGVVTLPGLRDSVGPVPLADSDQLTPAIRSASPSS